MISPTNLLISKLRGHTIAIIDTQDTTYKYLSNKLQPYIKIVHFTDQSVALSSFQENTPNLILINCEPILDSSSSSSAEAASFNQQQFDGYEICQQIKQLEAFTVILPVPTILYGIQNTPSAIHSFKQSSADYYILSQLSELSLIKSLSQIENYKYISD